MKKSVKIVLAVIAVVLAAAGTVTYAVLPHALSYNIKGIEPVGNTVSIVEEDEDSVTVTKSGNGDFRVLMFTDIHLDGKNKTSAMTVDNLVKNIQREKPDLVILGGDNVTSAMNTKRANQLAEIFEKLDVYWAGVLGNHEGDNKFSLTREDMMDIFTSYDHCLMKKGEADVDGNCNYALNILNKDGKTIKQTFFFMDTFDEMPAELKEQYGVPADKSPYDGTRENQVQWYYNKNTLLKGQYGDFKSSVVVHIPLPQYKTAFEEGAKLLYGGKLENICASGFDAGLFEAIKICSTTQAVFCGHDHLNDFGLEYDGVLLTYMQPSGYGSYTTESKLGYEEKDWLQGCTLLTISDDGSFEQTRMRNCEVNK